MSPARGAELYLDHLEKLHQSPFTLRGVRRFMEAFACWLEGKEIDDLRDVTLQHLLDYYESLRARRKPNGEHNTAGYANSQVWHVSKMLRLLHQRGKLLIDPSRNLPPLHKPHRLPKAVLNGEQVNRLLNQPDTKTMWGFRDRAILELMYSSGLRGLEVVRLTIHDLDWKERLVRVRQGKGRKDRLVPMGAVACSYLLEYIERIRPVMLSRYNDPRTPGRPTTTEVLDLLFFSRNRTPMRRQYLRETILRYAKKARLPRKVTTHSIRHACATEMLRGGASVRHVQELLGHSSLTTTQVYTHVLPYDLKKVHARTAPSERRRVIHVPAFEMHGWRDQKNSGHYK